MKSVHRYVPQNPQIKQSGYKSAIVAPSPKAERSRVATQLTISRLGQVDSIPTGCHSQHMAVSKMRSIQNGYSGEEQFFGDPFNPAKQAEASALTSQGPFEPETISGTIGPH